MLGCSMLIFMLLIFRLELSFWGDSIAPCRPVKYIIFPTLQLTFRWDKSTVIYMNPSITRIISISSYFFVRYFLTLLLTKALHNVTITLSHVHSDINFFMTLRLLFLLPPLSLKDFFMQTHHTSFQHKTYNKARWWYFDYQFWWAKIYLRSKKYAKAFRTKQKPS